ncbi:MAG: dihydroorotate dehydrogenase electron transfer subunit, partial [Anaerovoracaceae bacterium]
MKRNQYQIMSNEQIAENTYQLILAGDTAEITAPGQFVNIKIQGLYLRRPISICDYEAGKLTLVYKVVGEGTKRLSAMKEGMLDILCPLGNGYDLEAIPEGAILVGGGVGVPPMYGLAKAIAHKKPKVFLGFNRQEEVFFKEAFEALGLETVIKVGGYITEVLPEQGYVCACGPEVMLKAIDELSVGGQ